MRPRCTTGCVAEMVIWTRKLVTISGRRDTLYPIGLLKTTIILDFGIVFRSNVQLLNGEPTIPIHSIQRPGYPFQLSQDSTVTAKIYDVTGKQIRMIGLGYIPAGNYVESSKAIYWDGKTDTGEQVTSGTYFSVRPARW